MEQGRKFGQTVAEALGCADAKTAAACLRKKPVKELLTAASKAAAPT